MDQLHRMLNMLGQIPPSVDIDSIQREWDALTSSYSINQRRLPLPVWARRGLTDNAQQAWSTVQDELKRCNPQKAFCIYIHVPFCSRKCAFCDCYSFRLEQHRDFHIEGYTAALEQEMRLWVQSDVLAQRPVSTVHFGGGTPAFLGPSAFHKLVETCRRYFNISPETEWALETTSSELTDEMFALLNALGFTRLHMGVQSLDESIRSTINRQESAETMLRKLSRAVAMGWVTSVDLIYGLPTQSLDSLLHDIDILAQIRVDGFSLYELQRSSHNHRFIEQSGLLNRDRRYDYLLFQAATRALISLGYQKTLFNHFANKRDTNLYFTFPERGEDCLALGTIADGIFNDYHYRHPTYAAYCKKITGSFPGLQGGVRQDQNETRMAPLEVSILSGRIQSNQLEKILGKECAQRLLQHWHDSAFITSDPNQAGLLNLTSNGSWFVGEMMAELPG